MTGTLQADVIKDSLYLNAGNSGWKTKKWVRNVGVSGGSINQKWVKVLQVPLTASAYTKTAVKMKIHGYDDVSSGTENIDVRYENASTAQEYHEAYWYTTDNTPNIFSEVRSIRYESDGLTNSYQVWVKMAGDWRDTFTVEAEYWISGTDTISFPTEAGTATAPSGDSNDIALTTRSWKLSNSSVYIGSAQVATQSYVTGLGYQTSQRAISSTPTDGATTTAISSDWAFDNVKTAVPASAVFTDTVNTFDGAYGSLSGAPSLGSAALTAATAYATASHTHGIAGVTDASRWWNNFGDNHDTRTSFDAASGALTTGFGWRYVQGSGNSPGTSTTPNQYYALTVGLGNDYDYDNYAMQLAIPRNTSSPYISVRFEEGESLGSWQKTSAGYADSAGAVTWANVSGKPTIPSGNAIIDWTTDQGTTNIHSGNYTDTNTTYTAGTGLALSSTTFKLNGGSIAGSIDLNTMRSTGVFSQNSNSQATSGSNYPQDLAGILEVYNDDYGNGLFTVQRYSSYNNTNVYNRIYYNGTWGSWRNLSLDTNTDTVYTHPTTEGNKHVPSGGAAGEFLRYNSAGTAEWATPSYITNTDTDTTYTAGTGLTLTGTAFSVTAGTYAAAAHDHSRILERSTITYGASQLQWTDLNGTGGTGLNGAAPDNPFSDWWHHIIMNHANNSGYYVDIAACFHSDDLYFRRNVGGTLSAWREIYHTGNLTPLVIGTTASTAMAGNTSLPSTPGDVGLGNLSSSGNALAGAFTATGDITAFSDARVKENVETIPNALEKVTALRGVNFNKIGEEKRSTGVIAQEVKEVLPEVIHENEDGMLSVAYGNITGVLIEAIKEQQKQIEELKAMVINLKNNKS
jgi:hypothetical protein